MADRLITATLQLKDQLSENAKRMQKELRGINKAIEKNRNTLGDLKLKYIAAAAAIAGAVRVMRGAFEAQSKQVEAINALNLALSNQGNLLPGTSQRLQEYASQLQSITTFGDEVILQNQALLASFGMNEEQLRVATQASLDFASATGRDLRMAVNLVGKAFVGETGELSRYGIVIDKNIPKSEKFAAVMEQLQQRFGGAAQTATKNFAGQMKQLGNAAGDVQEALGKFLGEFLKLGGGMQPTLALLERVKDFFGQDLVIALGEARALFAEFVGVAFDLLAKLASGMENLLGERTKKTAAVLSTIPGPMQKIAQAIDAMVGGGAAEKFKIMAEGQRQLAQELRDESMAAAMAAGSTQEFTNRLAPLPTVTADNSKTIAFMEDALKRLNQQLKDDSASFMADALERLNEELERVANSTDIGFKTLNRYSDQLLQFGVTTADSKEEVDKIASATENFAKILEEAAHLTTVFGRTLGSVFGGAASAIGGFRKLFEQEGGGFGFGKIGELFKKDGALSFGSFLSGITTALPAIGALAGPVVQLFGKIFKPAWKKLAEESAKIFGQELSEGLSRELVKVAKQLGSTQNAFAARIGDIVQEIGVNAQNVTQVLQSFNNMLGMIENGTLDWAAANEQINKSFPQIVDYLETMGTKGSVEIGKLVSRMRELGEVSSEVQAFIEDKAQSAVSNLGRFFEYLASQEELTSEQASAALTQMAGAFQAAIQATGSLAGAIGMLGDGFGALLGKLRDTLGENNALLNSMTQYYNFVQANQEQLSAIEALANGFKDLTELGIINRNNINDFAASFKTQFEEMLSKTQDQTTALAAMGPQIGQLLEAYQAMGVQVPDWLTDIATKAKEAGASLAPPEGLPDILRDIRDIMLDIAEALGAASRNANDFGRNMSNIRGRDVGGGRSPTYDFSSAQSGMFKKLSKDTLILAHAGEFAAIIPKNMKFVSARRGLSDDVTRGGGGGGGGGGGMIGSGVGAQMPIITSSGGGIFKPITPEAAATHQEVEELTTLVRQIVERPPQTLQPVIAPSFDIDLPSMVNTREGIEAARDVLLPELVRAVRLNLKGAADQLADSLKGRL